MGSPISGLLADIYVDHIEEQITQLPEYTHVSLWRRYVDDILCFWTGTMQELTKFFEAINNISNLKFTIETEINNSLNYLDLTLTRNTHNIDYNIYRKPTSTDVIIPFNSSHAPQIKTSSFNFMFHRLLNTPLTLENFNQELATIIQIGKNNNYPLNFMLNIFHKTKKRTMLNHIYPHLKTSSRYIAIPYYPHIHNDISKILTTHNINITARSHPTLANLLINTKPPQHVHNKAGIYEINCNDCQLSYIGLTTRNLKTRFKEHQKNTPRSAIGSHTLEKKHTISLAT
ncbi:hypothetical protein RI129_008136 [Pyrocoelia pectoralis]|uniref:GIY-YIG domain-containing protein n=1 Tax=Pyrocoelia pectoralis TaxID=417401 RepID=A0AAN7VEV3_9COLE